MPLLHLNDYGAVCMLEQIVTFNAHGFANEKKKFEKIINRTIDSFIVGVKIHEKINIHGIDASVQCAIIPVSSCLPDYRKIENSDTTSDYVTVIIDETFLTANEELFAACDDAINKVIPNLKVIHK